MQHWTVDTKKDKNCYPEETQTQGVVPRLLCNAKKPTSLNNSTGVSPAEMLFGLKIRTKLPDLSDVHVEQEVRDRDNEQKGKSKAYAVMQRNSRYFLETKY